MCPRTRGRGEDELGRPGEAIRYLALGDSYTIGTGASDKSHNYPSIIAGRITEATRRKVDLTNPAVNGFTTLDVILRELPLLGRVRPHLVSILIGVNDIVQGRTAQEYQTSIRRIYGAVAELALPPGNVVAISIPNWSVVPAARDFDDPRRLRDLTEEFNQAARNDAESHGFTWVDITAASTSGAGTGWISADQLHPGDAQYSAWADVIWASVKEPWTRS